MRRHPPYLCDALREHTHENVTVDVSEEARCEMKLGDRGFDQQLLQASKQGFKGQSLLLRLADDIIT
jgi:hypothetical protein